VSRLIHEQFEGVLGDTLDALPILSHRLALFESYRRLRNHNWKQAYRFILGALLLKHREMFGSSSLPFKFSAGHGYQLDILEKEIAATDYKVAPQAAAGLLRGVAAQIKEMLTNDCWEEAASQITAAYSTADELLPGIFDFNRAKCLTPRLYQPSSLRLVNKGMMWGKVWGRPGSEEEECTTALATFLRVNSDVVRKFGQPHYTETDDRYWRWWEFAIFHGERWHTFHLNTDFEISLETILDSSNKHAASKDLLRDILGEFRACKY
jgi:hypothetical protein